MDIDSGADVASERIESAFGGTTTTSTTSSSTFHNLPSSSSTSDQHLLFSSSTPDHGGGGSTTYEEINTVGPNGEAITGYKKTFTSSTTSTKTRSYGGGSPAGGAGSIGGGSSGSLQLQSESLRQSISPIPVRSSSSMSKLLNQESSSSALHEHNASCSSGHSHEHRHSSSSSKRPSSSGEKAGGAVQYSYRREEKRESRSSTTPRESTRKNVKWSDSYQQHKQQNKENLVDFKDIDFLPDPDLDKDISLHTVEKTTSRTSRRYKDESSEKNFSYGDFAMIPPSAARSPLPQRKTQVRDRSPSPTMDPRSPSPTLGTPVVPPKFMETRTPSPHAKCGHDLEKEHNCKYHSHHLDYKYTPPPVKGPCVACGQYIVGSLVTALDQMWHPECFTCVNCDCILKAHNYAVEDGKQYCRECHLRLFGPPCSVCHKPTQSNRYNLLNRIWHPECFCCVECGKRLTPDNFIERLGAPYCKEDYHRLFSPKCCVCHLPITDKAINALNKMWHPHCFKCTHCGIPLEERNFYEKNGLPYCEKDYMDLFNPKCWGCKKPITDGRQVVAMGHPWHPECFRCTVCVKPLSPDNFKEHDGKPYCEKDYNNLFAPKCAGCKGPIVDTLPVYNKGLPWHPECDAAFNRQPPVAAYSAPLQQAAPPLPPPPVFEPLIDIDSLLKPLEAPLPPPPKPAGPPCFACRLPIDTDDFITAMGQNYHPQCFTCTECAKPLSPYNFYEKNGKPYCEDDYHRLFSPKCFACKEPIKDNDFITAMGHDYHPKCFKCTECAKPLSPYNFYEKNGLPYCEDDYHKLFSPKCYECKEPIRDNDYITAMGHNYHPKCFKCTECTKPLNPYNFYEKNGLPYCEDDYHKLFSPKCAGCKEPIKDNNYIRAMGKDWHPNCFKCTQCKIPLDPENFYEKNGLPYCEKDYHNLFSPKCAGCIKPIKGTPLRAMGKDWHPECFNCTKCHIPLSPDNFFEKNGKPYCEKDYYDLFSPKCYACLKPIKGRPLRAMGQEWHPECFKCTQCKIPLSPDAFMEKNGKPYCLDDYHRLFSPKCCACNLPIKEKPVFALGKEWHPHCFVCSHPRCDRVLDPNNFETHDGKPYCRHHFQEMFLPKCFACKKPITDKVVSALGKTWHPECFACVQCNQPLDLNSFREKDGLPYCEADYHALFSPKCAACEAPIIEKCLTALGKTWHPEHFTCQHCNKIMADDPEGYHEHEGKGYCRPCYIELFAPYCRGCNKSIVDKICVTALNSKYHTDCFVCRDCSCPLKNGNYFEFEGEPYCEEHFRCKMCPDCVKLRRAQNKYFGTLNGNASSSSSAGGGQKAVSFNTGSLPHQHHNHGNVSSAKAASPSTSRSSSQAQQQHPFSIRLGA